MALFNFSTEKDDTTEESGGLFDFSASVKEQPTPKKTSPTPGYFSPVVEDAVKKVEPTLISKISAWLKIPEDLPKVEKLKKERVETPKPARLEATLITGPKEEDLNKSIEEFKKEREKVNLYDAKAVADYNAKAKKIQLDIATYNTALRAKQAVSGFDKEGKEIIKVNAPGVDVPRQYNSLGERYSAIGERTGELGAEMDIGIVRSVGSILGGLQSIGNVVLNPLGKALAKATNGVNPQDTALDLGGTITKFADNLEKYTGVEEKNYLDHVFQGLGSTLPFLGAGLAGKVLGMSSNLVNIGVSGTEALVNAYDDFKTLEKDAKGSKNLKAVASFGANLAVNYVTNKLGFLGEGQPKNVMDTVKKFVISGLLESGQETTQQLVSNIVNNKNPLEALKDTFLVSLPISIPFGIAGAATNIKAGAQNEKLKDFIDEVAQSGATKKEIVDIIEVITGLPKPQVEQQVNFLTEGDRQLETTFTKNTKASIERIAQEMQAPKAESPFGSAIQNIAMNFRMRPNEIEGLDKDQKTKLTLAQATPLAESAAEQYWNRVILPTLKTGEGIVIGADNLKDFFGKDYNENNHPVYSKAAGDMLFKRALAENSNPDVIFTAGGPGSGKTELITKTDLSNGFQGTIYDSNLSNYEGAREQIELAREAGKNIIIKGIIPDLEISRGFTLLREEETGRGVQDESFAHGHSQWIEVVRKLIKEGVVKPSEVQLIDTRGIKSKEDIIKSIKKATSTADPLALLKDIVYDKSNVKRIYSKENYEKVGDQYLLNSRGRNESLFASSQDRTNQGRESDEQEGSSRIFQEESKKINYDQTRKREEDEGPNSILIGKSEYGNRSSERNIPVFNSRRTRQAVRTDGDQVRPNLQRSVSELESAIRNDRLDNSNPRLERSLRENPKNAGRLVRHAQAIADGELVEINEDTFPVLAEIGFSESLVSNLESQHKKGAVKNLKIVPTYNGHYLVGAFEESEGGNLYLNPREIESITYKNGNIISHEVQGHGWFFSLLEKSKKDFFDNLKFNPELIKQAWQLGDNDHNFYWRESVNLIRKAVLQNSSEQITKNIVDDFVGLTIDFQLGYSLDYVVNQSLTFDKKIEVINRQLTDRGYEPIKIEVFNLPINKEHGAMIAENASELSTGEEGMLSNYIEDIKNGTLKYGPSATQDLIYQGETDLTITTLEKLKGRSTVSKIFIQELTNAGDLKQVERDIVRDILDQYPDGAKIPVKEFAEKVKVELLPLTRNTTEDVEDTGEPTDVKYESITLPDDIRGNVANYTEHVYEGPIPTSAGGVHFDQEIYPNYFGHTRIEDMQDLYEDETGLGEKQETRRVIEVQSDLYQKGRLQMEDREGIKAGGKAYDKVIREGGSLKEAMKADITEGRKRADDVGKLQQYNDPTAHFRMVREEVKKAAEDGKTKLQFPTGETAMQIEGLGGMDADRWNIADDSDYGYGSLKPENLKVGATVYQSSLNDLVSGGGENAAWVVTDVLGDGKFKAVPKDKLTNREVQEAQTGNVSYNDLENSRDVEEFDISGKVDTNNPIYRFYEKDLGRYLKNKYGAERVTDDKGVTWYEVKIKPEMATAPVIAFRQKTTDIEQLRKMLAREEESLSVALANPEAHALAYGPERIESYRTRIQELKTRIAEAKNPTFQTGDIIEDLKKSLDHVERRVGVTRQLGAEKVQSLTTPEKVKMERSIPESKIELTPELEFKKTKINGLTEVINSLNQLLADHPGKRLQRFKQEGIFQDFQNPELAETPSEEKAIRERNAKIMKTAQSALQGTQFADEFDNPDTIRAQIDEYKDTQERVKALSEERVKLKREFYQERKDFFTEERTRFSVNSILEREYRLSALREVEKILRKEGRDRKQKVDAIQEFFVLTDKEMKEVRGNADFRLLSDKEFEGYLAGVEGKAYEAAAHREAILEIENTIQALELRKVENLREAMKLKEFKNMSLNELSKFNELLSTFEKGDEFLGKRQLQTVRFTDMAGIKTKREALSFLAKEAGVPAETMKDIQVKEFDKFLYDTALARKNPFYQVMVNNANLAEVEAGLRFQEIKTESDKLIREARASRKRSVLGRLIPTDHMIFDYLEADADTKKDLAVRMTPEEYKAAIYIRDKYAKVRDYLLEQETLKRYRENYITHTRRDFLEAWKESSKNISLFKGFKEAILELFDSYKGEQAVFNILDQKTGTILPLEKFFKFSMQRSGNLVPSRNVSKAFLEYMRTFEKKRQFDSFIPKLDIFAHVLAPSKMTPRGLEFDDSLKRFVKTWLNSKKGRVMDVGLMPQGGKIDFLVRSGVAFTRLLDLGLNVPVGLASNIGEQAFSFIQLGPKKYALGVARYGTPKGRKVVNQYESLIGEKFIDKLRDTSKSLGDKLSEGFYGLFSSANRRSNAINLLANMTTEEYANGKLSSEKLAAVKKEISKYHVTPGMESMVGKTAIGAFAKQYKTWAVPAFHTTLNNLSKLKKMAKDGEFKNGFKSQESAELFRGTLLVTTLVLLGYGAYDELKNKKGRTFLENLAFKSLNDALSIIGALNPSLYLSEPRLQKFLADLSNSMTDIIVSLTTGDRTAEGKITGANKLKSTLTPALGRQIFGNEKETKEEKTVRNIYNQVQDMKNEGDEEGARELLNKAFPETPEGDAGYKIYQSIKTAERKKVVDELESDMVPYVKQVYELKQEGKTEELAQLSETLFPDTPEGDLNYSAYKQAKKHNPPDGSKPVYENDEIVNNDSIFKSALTYAKAIGVSPLTAFNRIFTGQKIRRVDNGAVIVERMSLEDSSKIKKERQGNNPEMKLDHLIPLQLGGSNSGNNLIMVTSPAWASYTPIENYLGKKLRAGEISKKDAQRLITDLKVGAIRPEDVYNYQK